MAYRDEHHTKMPYLSEEGRKMETYLKSLSDKYGYKKLPVAESERQRQYYMQKLDPFWRDGEFLKYDLKLTTYDGTCLATGVTARGFVCGDYGVFLEIDNSQINRNALQIQKGEEYRVHDPQFRDKVKYQWYTDKEGNGIKMYFQQKGVTYADYKAGKWYVSPYEVTVERVRKRNLTPQEWKQKREAASVAQQGDRPAVSYSLF